MGQHHHLYTKNRWLSVRKHQLMKEPLCRFCAKQGLAVPATVVDHVKPHHGDEQLFWFGELQSLCEPCHNGAKQQEERHGFISGCDAEGWPLDPNHPALQERTSARP